MKQKRVDVKIRMIFQGETLEFDCKVDTKYIMDGIINQVANKTRWEAEVHWPGGKPITYQNH